MNDSLEDNVTWSIPVDVSTEEEEHLLYLEWMNDVDAVDAVDAFPTVEEEHLHSLQREEEEEEKEREANARELKIWLELFDLRYPTYY